MGAPAWLSDDELLKLPPARGVAGDVVFAQNMLAGWIFSPDQPLDAVEIHLNGEPIAFVPLWEREDVGEIYPRYPQALKSGYQIKLPAGMLLTDGINRVLTAGYFQAKPRRRQRAMAFTDQFIPSVPIPPAELIIRTQGPNDEVTYRHLGYRYYREVLDAVLPHRDPRQLRKMLDWGCGSGRVAANFLADPAKFEVYACDPHPPSIAWCQAHLPRGKFDVSPWDPPLKYSDGAFDLVIGLGVVYLFNRDQLVNWLRDLKRMLAKRGLLVFSIQGEFAANVRLPAAGMQLLEKHGVINLAEYDAQHPPAADEKLFRGGYYWSMAQVKELVAREFRLLDYLEGAFGGDQDLLVLERAG